MHDVTLVYTEYNHRLEVWVLGKRAANTTADRQQYTNTSKVCDDTMSMDSYIEIVGVSRGYTDHYQGQGQSSRLTAALINIHEPLI